MPSFNKVILAGHLTRDPEVRAAGSTTVCNTGVAVNEVYKKKDGSKVEDVSFFDITAFGATAETMGKHLKKGRAVLIDGRLKQEKWDDKESGQKRSKVVVLVDRLVFLGSPNDAGKPAGDDDIPY